MSLASRKQPGARLLEPRMKIAWPGLLIAAFVVVGLLLLTFLRPAVAPDVREFRESREEPSDYQQAFEQRMQVRQQADSELSERLYSEQINLIKREKLLRTPECQFWWQQDALRSTPRTREKKQQYCDV